MCCTWSIGELAPTATCILTLMEQASTCLLAVSKPVGRTIPGVSKQQSESSKTSSLSSVLCCQVDNSQRNLPCHGARPSGPGSSSPRRLPQRSCAMFRSFSCAWLEGIRSQGKRNTACDATFRLMCPGQRYDSMTGVKAGLACRVCACVCSICFHTFYTSIYVRARFKLTDGSPRLLRSLDRVLVPVFPEDASGPWSLTFSDCIRLQCYK